MLITKNSPAAAHLLDVTRTARRADQRPTGIDRIERAYIEWLCKAETPLFGILRTKLGYLLLDTNGCRKLLDHCDNPVWERIDTISRFLQRSDKSRAIAETGLREIAIDRSIPSRLPQMLKKHLPVGTVYFNVGQTNLDARIAHSLQACRETSIVAYLHDTIPMDLPHTQTRTSILKFQAHLKCVDMFADLVLCNSEDTKRRVLKHCESLKATQTHVVTPGLPDIQLDGDAPLGPWTGRPYFLAIGTIEPRKNIGFLLDVWEDFEGGNAPHLVICGRRGWMNNDVFDRLDNRPQNVHELNDLNDAQMWMLLNESNGLLFPSQAEGFGYPAIEAAHLSVPVICAPLHAFKNTLGDYAIYAETSERYVWTNNIEKLAQRRREKSGEQLRHRGFEAPSWQAHFNRLFTFL